MIGYDLRNAGVPMRLRAPPGCAAAWPSSSRPVAASAVSFTIPRSGEARTSSSRWQSASQPSYGARHPCGARAARPSPFTSIASEQTHG